MGKLNTEQIAAELAVKGVKLVDASGYTNMNSDIKVCCAKGHVFTTNIASVRKPSFCCPMCEHVDFVNPQDIPEKGNSFRIIAFDQATEKFGFSIFDDGKLTYYRLYLFSGALSNRLVQIAHFVKDFVIQRCKPDFIIMEDIQYQNNGLMTFKVLAELLGIIDVLCTDSHIEHQTVSPNVWRKYSGTNGKNRREEKMLSVGKVQEQYNIKVSDDIAESILIGNYAVKVLKPQIKKAFGV